MKERKKLPFFRSTGTELRQRLYLTVQYSIVLAIQYTASEAVGSRKMLT